MRPARCFAEPWWWVALGVLLLNDHLLKGANLLPGWLTGKISDFAGLLVAPALLVSAFRVRGRPGRATCFALIALPFVAIKLSTPAAQAVEALLALAGVPWRIWSDPTDLVALAALVPAWRWCRPRPAVAVRARAGWLDRSGVVLGGVACLATGADYQTTRTAAWLVNSTFDDHDVRLSRLPQPADCAALDPSLGWEPQALAFTFERVYRLERDQVLPLDRPFWDRESPDADPDTPRAACAAVLLEISGLPPTVVWWGDLPQREVTLHQGQPPSLDPQAVYLERAAARLFITGSEHVQTLPLESAP